MAMMDDQGRLFGRWNLLDAIVGVLLLGAIPLAYGGYLLFRTPPPVLTSVEPTVLTAGPNMRVKVRGDNLRPYLRASFGTNQGISFLFNNTHEAEVELGDIGPGTYDVVLYDFTQERSRLLKGLTIRPTPLPDTEVIAVGMLGHLTPEQARQVQPGMPLVGVGQVVQVGTPIADLVRVFSAGAQVDIGAASTLRVPVVVRLACRIQAPGGHPACYAAAVVAQPGSLMFVEAPFGRLPFQIDQLRSVEPLRTMKVTARVGGPPEVVAALRRRDVDLGREMNELAAGARLVAIGPGPAGQAEITVEASIQDSTAGLVYGAMPLRVGGPFFFRTRGYEVQGTVLALDPGRGEVPQ